MDIERKRERRKRVRSEGSRGCIYRAKLHFGQAVSSDSARKGRMRLIPHLSKGVQSALTFGRN